jgi:putative spermidine/putrescine transport system permease protein
MKSRHLNILGWVYCCLLIAFLLFPIIIMVPISFGDTDTLHFPPERLSLRWYETVLGDDRWLDSAKLSLWIAIWAAGLATVAGLLVGLVHMRLGRIGVPLRIVLMMPLVAPNVVIATGLFSLLLPLGLLGSPTSLILGHACLAVPLTMVIFLNAADSLDPLLWTAADSLGARWPRILREIVLPNLGISIVAAFLIAFITSWDEVTLAIFVGPIAVPTLPSRMFSFLTEMIDPAVTAIATMLIGVTALIGLLMIILNIVGQKYSAARRQGAGQ